MYVSKCHGWAYVWSCRIVWWHWIIWSKARRWLVLFWRRFEIKLICRIGLRVYRIGDLIKPKSLGFFLLYKCWARPFVNKLIEKRRALLFCFGMLGLKSRLFQRIVFIENALVLKPSRRFIRHYHRLSYKAFVSFAYRKLIVVTWEGQSPIQIWGPVRRPSAQAWWWIVGRAQVIVVVLVDCMTIVDSGL